MPDPNPPDASARRRVLAYADTPGFSGAEAVFCEVLNDLGGRDEIALSVALAASNREMAEALHGPAAAHVVEVLAHPPRITPAGLFDPRRIRAIRRVISGIAPDVLLVNLPGPDYGATPLLWDPGVPSAVALLHLHHGLRSRGASMGAIRDRLARTYLSRLDHLFVISPVGCGEASPTWGIGSERCSVLPLSAPSIATGDRVQSRSALGLDPSATLVGIVGRVEIGQKGHDTFVDAAAELAAERDDLMFVVVGDGPDIETVRRLSREVGIEGRVVFAGRVQPVEIAYAALDAIAIPSRFEGLPLTALEALAAGLPGVASAVDGLATVWPGEWLVSPDDPRALAAALASVLALGPADVTRVVAEAHRRVNDVVVGDPGNAVFQVLRRLAAPAPHR